MCVHGVLRWAVVPYRGCSRLTPSVPGIHATSMTSLTRIKLPLVMNLLYYYYYHHHQFFLNILFVALVFLMNGLLLNCFNCATPKNPTPHHHTPTIYCNSCNKFQEIRVNSSPDPAPHILGSFASCARIG